MLLLGKQPRQIELRKLGSVLSARSPVAKSLYYLTISSTADPKSLGDNALPDEPTHVFRVNASFATFCKEVWENMARQVARGGGRLELTLLPILPRKSFLYLNRASLTRTRHYRLNCSVLNEFACFMKIKKACLSSMYFSQILSSR